MPKISPVSVDSSAAVQELHAQLLEAEAELTAASSEVNALEAVISPLPSSSERFVRVSELDAIRARQQLPFAQERFFTARGSVLELRPRYQATRAEALRQLTDARNQARLPLLRQFADALDAAKTVGEELQAFDQETVQLGGSNPGHPFAQLLDEPPYRQGDATRVRQLIDTLEQN